MLWCTSLHARMKKDLFKNEGARVLTRLYIDFSQAKVTP